MAGALIKEIYPKFAGLDGKRLVLVSLMPCTAKKYEAQDLGDVDYVLTTRELAALWDRFGLDFDTFEERAPLDPPFAEATGAARLFGGTGGVMEAAVRTAATLLGGEAPAGPLTEARGLDGFKCFTVEVDGITLNLGVVNGLGRLRSGARRRPSRACTSSRSCPARAAASAAAASPTTATCRTCASAWQRIYDADAEGGGRVLAREQERGRALRGATWARPLERGLAPPAAPHYADRSAALADETRAPARPPAPAVAADGSLMDGIITTIKQNCRRCYTCVRDCPAKAIRIEDGQASVVAERCISCGNCTMVCSQDAKAYASGVEGTLRLLEQAASAARRPGGAAGPVLPGRASRCRRPRSSARCAQAGFTYVVEVAYGADLVNQACHDYLDENPTGLHIASACPAVVEYVRKYHPELTDRIMPIVSPMVATALAVKERYGQHVRCVFIGPCVAKKAEILDPEVVGRHRRGADPDRARAGASRPGASTRPRPPAGDFDPPHAGKAPHLPHPRRPVRERRHRRRPARPPSDRGERQGRDRGDPRRAPEGPPTRRTTAAAGRGAHVPGLLRRTRGGEQRARHGPRGAGWPSSPPNSRQPAEAGHPARLRAGQTPPGPVPRASRPATSAPRNPPRKRSATSSPTPTSSSPRTS